MLCGNKKCSFIKRKGVAEFPDGITSRGTKHLKELANVAKNGDRAVMLYLIQRNDCNYFKIAEDIDVEYGKAFIDALNAGVEVICLDTILNTNGINIGKNIKLLNK